MPERNFFDYDPSFSAAIVFAVLYTIPCIVTVYQYISLRCWFWIVFVIGSIMEVIGYVTRVISVTNQTSLGPYLIQFLMIFLAPAILAASCYMAMGRVVLHVTPRKYQTWKILWVTPRWMTPIFVGCDVLAFLIQVAGGSQVTSDDFNTVQLAFTIMKVGLGVQLACFGFFLVIAVRFHFVARTFQQFWPDTKWTKFLWVVNVSSLLIFIRSIYRMIEFAGGRDGYLLNHEWTFYVFESSIILPIFILFSIYHPANYVSNISFRQRRDNNLIPENLSETNVALEDTRSGIRA